MSKNSGLPAWMPSRGSRSLTSGRKGEAPQKPGWEVNRALVKMRCAVADKEFVISFRGNPLKPDTYFVERVKPGTARAEDNESGSGGSALVIPIERLPFDEIACPFCRVRPVGPVHCGRCGQLVCQGRLQGDIFHCAKSCGSSGRVSGGLQQVSGRESHSMRLLGASPTPRLAEPSTKLIGRSK